MLIIWLYYKIVRSNLVYSLPDEKDIHRTYYNYPNTRVSHFTNIIIPIKVLI